MSNHVHHVPGRLRARVPDLKGCPARALALRSTLTAIHGVTQVEFRPLTGSVIVYYQDGVADIDAVSRLLGCDRTVPARAAQLIHSQQVIALARIHSESLAAKIVRAALHMAADKATERAFSLLLAAVL